MTVLALLAAASLAFGQAKGPYAVKVDAALGAYQAHLARVRALPAPRFEMPRGAELAALTARLRAPDLEPRERSRIIGEGSRLIRDAFIATDQSWVLNELSLSASPPRLRHPELGLSARERYHSKYSDSVWDAEGIVAALKAHRDEAEARGFFSRGKRRRAREELDEALRRFDALVSSGRLDELKRLELADFAAWDGIVGPMVAFDDAARGR